MNEIYDIYRKIRADCTTHLEVQDKMIKDYGYTWQEITEAKVAMESNEPNYWVDEKSSKEWPACESDWDADMVNSPPHYMKGGIETIDFIQAKLSPEEYRGYLRGNLLKYASRMGAKGEDDAGKAAWYAKRLEEI
jgi:Protein of unknwon function (DUF3310)